MHKKLQRQTLEVAEAEATKHGVEISVEDARKHPIIVVSYNGKFRKHAISGTPRCGENEVFVRHVVRNLARTLLQEASA